MEAVALHMSLFDRLLRGRGKRAVPTSTSTAAKKFVARATTTAATASVRSEDEQGTVVWKNEAGKKHRLDGPAVLHPDGRAEWYQDGIQLELGPDGKPDLSLTDPKNTGATQYVFQSAVEWRDDQDRLHRLNGPARFHANGTQEWRDHGLPHRVGGPALIESDGRQEWCQQGKLHRDDGPAIIEADGTQKWWVDGKLHRDDGPAIEHPDGSQWWYQHGELHREDGVATVYPDGSTEWRLHGKLHRDGDLPAAEYSDGCKGWYQHGQMHRETGPANILEDGTYEWWLHGDKITEQEFQAFLNRQQMHQEITAENRRDDNLDTVLLGRRKTR